MANIHTSVWENYCPPSSVLFWSFPVSIVTSDPLLALSRLSFRPASPAQLGSYFCTICPEFFTLRRPLFTPSIPSALTSLTRGRFHVCFRVALDSAQVKAPNKERQAKSFKWDRPNIIVKWVSEGDFGFKLMTWSPVCTFQCYYVRYLSISESETKFHSLAKRGKSIHN